MLGIIAFAGVDRVASFESRNLELAKIAVPVSVFGIAAEAVLVMEFFGDLVECGFEFVHAANVQHAASGGLGELFESVFFKNVEHVAIVPARSIVNLEDVGNDVVFEKSLQSIFQSRFALGIA